MFLNPVAVQKTSSTIGVLVYKLNKKGKHTHTLLHFRALTRSTTPQSKNIFEEGESNDALYSTHSGWLFFFVGKRSKKKKLR